MSTDVKAAAVKHMNADELATRLGIDRWAVYQLVKTGALRALRIGRRVRFRLADVEAWEAGGGSPPKLKVKTTRGTKGGGHA